LEKIGYLIWMPHSAVSSSPLILHPLSIAFRNSTILAYLLVLLVHVVVMSLTFIAVYMTSTDVVH